ncbi:MAG: SipW-dependent-type signal peptide-containing protein [Clostridia bacterium]
MKKYLKPAIALCLVAALAIGGTLAYLTDSTDPLVNNFTVDESIGIELNETYHDFTLTPGTTQDKDPAITVTADSSYVFIEVVETIPTAALSGSTYSFSDYVVYSINGLYDAETTANNTQANAGGSIYSGGQTTATGTTDWYWMQVGTETTTTGDTFTTITYVYALVDNTGALLSVSSDDQMDGATGSDYVSADYPILTDDEVTIPEDLTSAMMELLTVTGETDEYYSVDLTFTGYAIQTEGLDDLSTNVDIYNAAKGTTTDDRA